MTHWYVPKSDRNNAQLCLSSSQSVCVFFFFAHTKYVFSGQFEVVSPTVSNYRGGMRAKYTVKECGLAQNQNDIVLSTKTYYIAAVEVEWDYSLSRTWETELYHGQERYRSTSASICTLGQISVPSALVQHLQKQVSIGRFAQYHPFLSWCSPASVFLDKQDGFIGSQYKKVVYRQFTSANFTKQVERTADMEHLGIMGIASETAWMFGSHIYITFSLIFCSCYDYFYFWLSGIVSDTGPMIHANVGDKVKVVFKNMASRPYSIHAHGVKTDTPDVNHTKPGTGRF